MGFFDSRGREGSTPPFSFDMFDPISARGAMVPLPWGNAHGAGRPTGRSSRSSTPVFTPPRVGISADAEGPDVQQQVIEGIGRTNVNLLGGLPEPGETVDIPQEEFRAAPELLKSFGRDLPFVNTWSEQDREHAANFFGLFGNVIDAGASLAGNIPTLNDPQAERMQWLSHLPEVPEVVELRQKMQNDPAFAARYLEEFISRERYNIPEWLGEAQAQMTPQDRIEDLIQGGPRPATDPLLQGLTTPAGSVQDNLWKLLQAVMVPSQQVGRLYGEHGGRNIKESILDADPATLPPHIRAIREKYEDPESGMTSGDLITELAMGGAAFSNDPTHNLVFEMLSDPLNVLLGAGLAKNAVLYGSRRALAATALRGYSERFGKEAADDLIRQASEAYVADRAARGMRTPTVDEVKIAGADIERRLDIIEKSHPDFVAEVTRSLPRKTRAQLKMKPALEAAAAVSKGIADPLSAIFTKGPHSEVIKAWTAAQSVEGVTHSYGIFNVNGIREMFDDLGQEDAFITLLGRMGANMEMAVHRESLIRGAVAGGGVPPAHYSPTQAVSAMSEARSSRLAMDVEGLTDRVKTQYLPDTRTGPEARVEELARQRRAAEQRLIALMGDSKVDAIRRFTANADEDGLAFIEHLYYMDLIERFAKARTAAEAVAVADVAAAEAKVAALAGSRKAGGAATKGQTRAAGRLAAAESRKALAARYSIVGPRELTDKRAKDLLAAVKRGDSTTVRDAIERYDRIYDNFSAKGLSDDELLSDMEVFLDAVIKDGGLVKTLDPSKLPTELRALVNDEKAFANRIGLDREGYVIGLAPEEGTLWRPTYAKDGRLIAINPWVDVLTESAEDYHIGRFGQARAFLTRPIRGQRLLEEAKRGFRTIAADAGMSRREANALFSGIRAESSKFGVMPRGLESRDIWRIAQGMDIDKALLNRIGERGLARMVAKAFEGNINTVGVSNKISGRLKASGFAGGVPSEFIRIIAERFYPNLRFKYNPIFIAQEAIEPFFWNVLRGHKPGIHWRLEDLQTLESMRRSGLISEFEDQYEYSTHILLGAQAVREAFGPGTSITKLWGKNIGAGRRVSSLAELKRLNFVRQVGRRHGEILKQSLDQVDPGMWDTLVAEVGSTNPVRVANHYWLNKALYAPDDPTVQTFLMDAHKPSSLGRRASIRTDPIARLHNFTDASAMRAAIAKGEYKETTFIDKMKDLGADDVYTTRAWRVLTSDPPEKFWRDYRNTVKEALGVDVNEATRVQKNMRTLVTTFARQRGMSEEEYLVERFNSSVQYVDSAGRLPRGAKMQMLRDGSAPMVWGRRLLPADDPRVLRVTEDMRTSFLAERLVSPSIPDPLGGAPVTHPDVARIVPQGGKEVKTDAAGIVHHTGMRTVDQWKESAFNVLGDTGVMAAADEADLVPSLMLRLAQSLDNESLERLGTRSPEGAGVGGAIEQAQAAGDAEAMRELNLAAEAERAASGTGGRVTGFAEMREAMERGESVDFAALGREAKEEEVARRLLRAWSSMSVQEDFDLSSSVTSLLAFTDEVLQNGDAGDHIWDLLRYGDAAMAEGWRSSGALRAAVDGDVAPTAAHQMRAFGYTDDIAMDDLNHVYRDPLDVEELTNGNRYGVLGRSVREAKGEEADIADWARVTRVGFMEQPIEVLEDVLHHWTQQPSFTPAQRGSLAAMLDLDDIADYSDEALLKALADEAEVATSKLGLWKSRRGQRMRDNTLRYPVVRDDEEMARLLAAHPDWHYPAELGEEQWRFMSRQYQQWADDLNAEEYLGRSDWTASRVAAVDAARYTQATRSGAVWDIADAARDSVAVLRWDAMPAPDTAHAALIPSMDEVAAQFPDELPGLGQVERDLNTWWANSLPGLTGVRVLGTTTYDEPIQRWMETATRTGGEVTTEPVASIGSRSTAVIAGSPDQIRAAVLATGAVFQRRDVGAYALKGMTRDRGPSVGERTEDVVSRAPDPFDSVSAVDVRVPAANQQLAERIFESLTEMLDNDWSHTDYGRMVFEADGEMVIRILFDDGEGLGSVVPSADSLQRVAAFDALGAKTEFVEVSAYRHRIPDAEYSALEDRIARGNAFRGFGEGEGTVRSADDRAARTASQRADEDPWNIALDNAGFERVAHEVRTRYAGEATTQADYALRQYLPNAYGARIGNGADLPSPLRGWKFSHTPRGIRGAVALDAEGRHAMFLLRNADVTTALHEMFHVFAKDLDPSMTNHLLKVYAAENSLSRVPKVMSHKAEDWLAEQFAAYVKTGTAPDPATQMALNAFGKMVDGVRGASKAPVSPELKALLDEFIGLPSTKGAHFHPDEHRIWQAARTAMSAAEDEAFSTHYFRRGRSFLERSINHPYLGMYPASYMWGKALPELTRFLIAKPFGVDAPLWGMSQAINVWEAIVMQLNSDPELEKFVSENWKQTIRFFQMLIPGSPVDIPVNFPSWVRTPLQTVMENEGRVERGLDPKMPDVIGAFAQSGGTSMNPLRFVETGQDIINEVQKNLFGQEEETTTPTLAPSLWGGADIDAVVNP